MYFVFTFLNVRVRVVAISNFANTTFTLYHTNGCTIEVMRVRTVPARDMAPGYGRRGE